MRTFIQLGKLGDIISLLPLLKREADLGEKPTLVVSKEFASVLDGVSYVNPRTYDGPFSELDKAVEAVGGEVVVTQVIGPKEVIRVHAFERAKQSRAVTDSFVKESWKLAGHLDWWYEQPPLVFDRRDPEREAKVLEQHPYNRKLLLVCLGGKSSPFPYANLCLELLRLKFRQGWNVLDLSSFKAERFYDLLALYERASCLVASDSAPLHLAAACPKLPVVALINDTPLPWNGSPWRPQHIFHCRYQDFPNRAVEMLDAILDRESPGSYFGSSELPGPTIYHCWSQMQAPDRAAEQTWEMQYLSGPWVRCPVEPGAVGKDSRWMLNDPERHPFLKAALRLPLMRTKSDDFILLTRPDTCFETSIRHKIVNQNPGFSFRRKRIGESYQHEPILDLFVAKKSWWVQHMKEIPELILGRDRFWDQVLYEIFKRAGATEILGAAYRL